MAPDDLCYLTIAEASRHLSSTELSPVELVEAHLERIGRVDGDLNSFITLLADESVAAARSAEREIASGGHLGPLHGIPIGLKDLYYTKGVRTTIGSKIFADFIPSYDATVTRMLRDAGAILLGKLQMHEFALGGTSENPHYGPAHNPWDTARITGGSSGGSGSAVAGGLSMGALGSDTGGSVRIPATLCGVVGLKPTFGRISRHGVYPLSWSYDTVGPLARTVEDAALMLNSIAGHDPLDGHSMRRPPEDFTASLGDEIAGLRIGVPKEHFFDILDREVANAVTAAIHVLEQLGATVEEVSLPMLEHATAVSRAVLHAEAAEIHLDHLRERPDDLDQTVRTRLETGAAITAIDYVRAQRGRSAFNHQVRDAFERVDLMVTPTSPISAPRIGEPDVTIGNVTEDGPGPDRTTDPPFQHLRLPLYHRALRLHGCRPAHRAAARGPAVRRGYRAEGRARL